MTNKIKYLDHGYVQLLNLAGPNPRLKESDRTFCADDTDPAATARISFNQDDKARSRSADIKLLEYLISHRHTTPIEMIECWFEMKLPIFVARQLVRHRTVSINEISARYTKLDAEFYIPEYINVGIKSASNKQGRDITKPMSVRHYNTYSNSLRKIFLDAYDIYEDAISMGVPNELARLPLPVAIYTRWIYKQDLWNLMHMLSLRLDPHAQYEIQALAQSVYDLVSQHLPKSMEFFNKYIR